METRISRRKWTTDMIGIKGSGGLTDIFDNVIKELLRITDDEYDYIADIGSEEDWQLILTMPEHKWTFAEKRKAISFFNKYVNEFKNAPLA